MFGEYVRRFFSRLLANIDLGLFGIVLPLLLIGLATVFSATYDTGSRVFSHLLNMAVGLGVMWGAAQCPPQRLMRFSLPL